MKRLVAVLAAAMLVVALAGPALAAVNAVTPSTNAINIAKGWGHVDVAPGKGSATLTFVSTRGFGSCFEYRTDGDTSQILAEHGGANYNAQVTDGLYPYRCVNNSTAEVAVSAVGYVEVRMVFGAERDERFDWTRFDVLPKCSPTGYVRDGMNLTAASIGEAVTGTLDATGCNIGAYNPTSVTDADIFGANYYGVLVDGQSANVTGSAIHDIGERPFNGAQHGNAVVYQDGATGTVKGNTVSRYQKNGITARDAGTAVRVLGNVVKGEGPVDYIAQNGIQISFGATAKVKGNKVSGNDYSPKTWLACGVLYYEAGGVRALRNRLFDNERNSCNYGKGGGRFRP